jgi:hypothetical protein
MTAKILSFPTLQAPKKRRTRSKKFHNDVLAMPRSTTLGDLMERAERRRAKPGFAGLSWDQLLSVHCQLMENDQIRKKMAKIWKASEILETPFEELIFEALDSLLEVQVAAHLEVKYEDASSQ